MASRLSKSLALMSIALVLNISAYDICRAAGDRCDQPDSSRVEPGGIPAPASSVSAKETPLVTSENGVGRLPARPAEEPGTAGEDSKGRRPIYKNKWLWAAAAGVVLATIVAIAAGGMDKSGRDLPDFPPPPTR